MSDFVRLRVSAIQSIDEGEIDELVVNRQYISHLVRRRDYTVVHFANGNRTVNVCESPTDILLMAPCRPPTENDVRPGTPSNAVRTES